MLLGILFKLSLGSYLYKILVLDLEEYIVVRDY